MRCLVIGATGIIGNHIVRELLEQGHEVWAGSRGLTPSINLEGLPVQRVQLDLQDVDSLKKAFQEIDWVFQAAAYYPKNAFQKDYHRHQAMNGTQNVLDALKDSQVKKLIYTSSLTTIGMAKKGEIASERIPYDMYGRDPHPYFLVKYLTEEMMLNAVKEWGAPIVVVNPTGCFGPYELKDPSQCLIPQLVRRKIPAYVVRDINTVDTRDVAKGHILAAEKGKDGERYILGGHNTNTEMLIREICDVARVKPPRLVIPLKLGVSACYMNESVSLLMKKQPKLSVLGLRFAEYGQHFTIEKAENELGYTPEPMEPCFRRAIEWYEKIGYC